MKEILERLDLLAAKLGQTAAYLWPHAIRYLVIEKIFDVVSWFIFTAFSVTTLLIGIKKGQQRDYEDGPYVGLLIGGGVGLLFSLVSLGIDGPKTFACIFEPVGYLTREILAR